MKELLAFLGVSALVIVTPGQDTALTIRSTLLGGRRAGVSTALGVSTGQAVWTLAASAGITALLLASEPAFLVVKLAGAIYLVVLGVQMLLHVLRRAPQALEFAPRRGGLTPATAYRQGVLSNLGNPKMAVFFTSLLPQFGTGFGELLTLGLLFATLTLVWLSGVALAVARTSRILIRGRVRRALDALSGLALAGLGVRLAAES